MAEDCAGFAGEIVTVEDVEICSAYCCVLEFDYCVFWALECWFRFVFEAEGAWSVVDEGFHCACLSDWMERFVCKISESFWSNEVLEACQNSWREHDEDGMSKKVIRKVNTQFEMLERRWKVVMPPAWHNIAHATYGLRHYDQPPWRPIN